MPTPLGPLTLVADEAGAIVASGFTEDVERLATVARVSVADCAEGEPPPTAEEAVAAYFAGDLAAIDRIEVRERGGAFHAAVRSELRAVPAGTQATYTALAARAGRPAAIRAAGAACAGNPASLFVPCHRAVRSDGALAGFLWGLELKRALVDHEAAHR